MKTGKYQVYPRYNQTDAKWLGQLPEHWDAIRCKYIYKEFGGRSEDGFETLLSVSEYYGIKPRSSVMEEGDFLSRAESLEGYKKCQANDLVMNIMLAWKTGLGVTKYDGIVSPAYSVFRLISPCSPDYMNYLLRTPLYTTEFKTKSTGVIDSRLRLYPESFGTVEIIKPPLEEQEQIANFLDHETAKIDTLIDKQQQLIKLLKEKRQAVISHAVTKGLNPDAPMKDSGVEWLGEVPEHWVSMRIGHATKIYRGKFTHRPRNDPRFFGGKYPFIQTGEVANAEVIIENHTQTLNEKGIEISQEFPAGTLLMGIVGAKIGCTAILGFDSYCPDSVVGFYPLARVNVFFLRYLFVAALQILESTATQSAQPNLNIERVASLPAVFPEIEEQAEIVQRLDRVDRLLSVVNAKVKESINLLIERRTALISAAVTGKIDVRNWQPPKSDFPQENAA